MKKGLFITFEGPDGCGKTSIINLLKEYYKDNKKILFTREPDVCFNLNGTNGTLCCIHV